MKILSLMTAFILSATVAMSCTDSDDIKITETRNVENFNRINVSAPVTVILVCGKEQSVKVSGKDHAVSKVITEVVDGELNIKVDGHRVHINRKTTVEVNVESLTAIRASGACALEMPVSAEFDNLELKISGASDVNISEIEVKGLLNAQVSGASDLDIKCKVGKAEFTASGASDVDIPHIETDEIEVTASGASDIDVRGRVNNIKVNASGASEVNLRHLNFNSHDFNKSGASDIDL
ncbi:MAG: DUF2807 domain-containing protein [Bacteroidales bacterium]|nr:DUF2807 domain-containing protein [Bacteroidales bacterium]